MEDVAAECVREIARAKGIPAASIALDSTLESLQLDSLDRVSLSFDLEEKYGIVIPEHRLYAVQTVNDIVQEVSAAVEKTRSEKLREPQP